MLDEGLFNLLLALFVFGGIGFTLWALVRQGERANEMFERWLTENGYRLVKREERTLRRGPFTWSTARGQVVYYVEVIDAQGRPRTGWLRLGTWWSGVFGDKTEERWEDD